MENEGLVVHKDFEDFLMERGDKIDNAAFDLLFMLSGKTLDWDISIIRELVEYAEQILKEKDIPFCDPYYETPSEQQTSTDGEPCTTNGCENCKDCMFKRWQK